MEQYIVGLFQNMSWLTIALLGAGVLLCVVEVFVPKIGLTGVLGVALLVCGLSSYYLDGFKFKQLIGILSIVALVLAVFIMIELVLESKGVIRNPDRHKFRTYEVNLNDLVGVTGRAITNIDFGGTVEIKGKLYYATSDKYIAQGMLIEVIGVHNNSLVVKAW